MNKLKSTSPRVLQNPKDFYLLSFVTDKSRDYTYITVFNITYSYIQWCS